MGGRAKRPRVEKRDLKAEQLEAERKATEKANAEIAFKRTQRKSQSLIANPGGAAGVSRGRGGAGNYASVISQPAGKQTLG